MPELSLPQSSDREARIRANLEKNAELEAKIADLQMRFNERISQDHGSRMIRKHDAIYNEKDHNPVDGRYDDLFYSEMATWYGHRMKYESPTKRLIKQKDATVALKTANPHARDTQLYLTDANLKAKKHAY